MALLYMVVAGLVMILFISLPLFPFCKVWRRLKHYHLDLWNAKGPFEIWDMMAHPSLVRSFMDIIALADKDETLAQRDPELVKWTRVSREVWRMMPRTFLSQIGYTLVFLYFVGFFTSVIVGGIASLFGPAQ